MNTHTDKTGETKSNAAANNLPGAEKIASSSLLITDNRPEAIAQRKLQGIANPSGKQVSFHAQGSDVYAASSQEQLFSPGAPVQQKQERTKPILQLKTGIYASPDVIQAFQLPPGVPEKATFVKQSTGADKEIKQDSGSAMITSGLHTCTALAGSYKRDAGNEHNLMIHIGGVGRLPIVARIKAFIDECKGDGAPAGGIRWKVATGEEEKEKKEGTMNDLWKAIATIRSDQAIRIGDVQALVAAHDNAVEIDNGDFVVAQGGQLSTVDGYKTIGKNLVKEINTIDFTDEAKWGEMVRRTFPGACWLHRIIKEAETEKGANEVLRYDGVLDLVWNAYEALVDNGINRMNWAIPAGCGATRNNVPAL